MSRFGKIVSVDHFIGEGEILDEHEQEISFSLQHVEKGLLVGSAVSFEIEFTELGLRAVEIKKAIL